MLGVLHTWSRTLIFHPHIHYLIPGGGLSPDGRRWMAARQQFLLPVKALGAHFRTVFKDPAAKRTSRAVRPGAGQGLETPLERGLPPRRFR